MEKISYGKYKRMYRLISSVVLLLGSVAVFGGVWLGYQRTDYTALCSAGQLSDDFSLSHLVLGIFLPVWGLEGGI